jgi:H+/Cl- antiporter ClcA
VNLPTPPRRTLFLALVAGVLGLIGGGAAYVLLKLIALITNVALFHRVGWELPSFRNFHPDWTLIPAALAGGLVVSLMAKWAPVIRGHGIPEAMEAVLTKQSRIQPRAAIAKPLSSAVAIGTGGPFGAEGPIIVTGGAIGSLLGQVLQVSPSERKILLASGAAAGMAATFGTPLAAVVLAIELLLFEFSTRAFIPLVVASALAGGVHSAIFGSGPLFAVPAHSYAGLDRLGLYAVLGVVSGILAVVIAKGLFLFEGGFRRLPVGEFWHPMIGALGFALVGLVVPRALGVGYDAISDVLLSKIAVGALLALALAKLLAWWVALASGTSGGTLAPVLLISGSFGSLFGTLVSHVFPSAHINAGAFALVAMAATFGAATRATFTSIVFLFELTRDYEIILPLMLATVIADLVAGSLLRESLMTEKLARRGLRVSRDYHADPLRTTLVREIMTRDPETLPVDATVGDARQLLSAGRHGAFPLVDESGGCRGMVSRSDLLLDDTGDDEPVTSIASEDVVAVSPDDTALMALKLILEEEVDHLPVLEDDRVIGICTRTDIVRSRTRQFEHERAQRGWRPRFRSPAGPPGSAKSSG